MKMLDYHYTSRYLAYSYSILILIIGTLNVQKVLPIVIIDFLRNKTMLISCFYEDIR